jgi:hypothetical protein
MLTYAYVYVYVALPSLAYVRFAYVPFVAYVAFGRDASVPSEPFVRFTHTPRRGLASLLCGP